MGVHATARLGLMRQTCTRTLISCGLVSTGLVSTGLVKFPSVLDIIGYTANTVELDELLSTLVNDVDGALGAAIGGMDGLLIEQYAADPSLNLDTIIAEHANILKSVKAAYSVSLTAGNVTEIMITAEQMLGFTKEVTPEFFLTIILEPKGNIGKARVLGAMASSRIREVVS
jgi:uncharacterized protein